MPPGLGCHNTPGYWSGQLEFDIPVLAQGVERSPRSDRVGNSSVGSFFSPFPRPRPRHPSSLADLSISSCDESAEEHQILRQEMSLPIRSCSPRSEGALPAPALLLYAAHCSVRPLLCPPGHSEKCPRSRADKAQLLARDQKGEAQTTRKDERDCRKAATWRSDLVR